MITRVLPCVVLLAFGAACKEAASVPLTSGDAGSSNRQDAGTSCDQCFPPRECSREGVCTLPPCQTDNQCPPGSVCRAGVCGSDRPDQAETCVILTASQPIRAGAVVELEGLVLNRAGAVIPGLELEWMSSDESVARISGSTAIGGMSSGVAGISAGVRLLPDVTCGGLVLTSFTTLPNGVVRVVAASEETLRPLAGAEVTIFAGSERSAITSAQGAATFQTLSAIQSVTVIAAGHHAVSVLSPGTNDLFVLLQPVRDRARAGGFRGSVDMSATERGDISIGVAGFARRMNILDYQISPEPIDIIPTLINAPELGLDNQVMDLPGNYLLRLGNARFTEDDVHCQGTPPSADELGCYLVRAPAGRTTPYIFAGQLRLSDIAPIANELSSILADPRGDETTYRTLLKALSPVIPRLWHGLLPLVDIEEFPLGAAGPDFSNYQRADLRLSYEVKVHAIVSVRDMPPKLGSICPAATLLTVYSVAPGRGLIPLGLRVVPDVAEGEAPDCRVAGIEQPFGPRSAPTEPGEIPISIAPLHSGLEGTKLLFVASAHDTEVDPAFPSELSTVFKRSDRLDVHGSIDQELLPFPHGVLRRGSATFEVVEPGIAAAATAVRVHIHSGDQQWFVYAPAATSAAIELPNVASLRALLASSDAAVARAFSADADYSALFTLGSGKTLDRLVETIQALASEDAELSN